MEIIKLRNVSVKYGDKVALSNATFNVATHDFIGVVGPNGGGKTTLIKAILGLIDYDGEICIHPDLSSTPGSIGYLPQQSYIDRSFPITVKEIILSGLQSRNRRDKDYKSTAIDNLIDITGIKSLLDRRVNELSGGEFQRTLLCRAIISEPKLLILDEPANFVDSKFEKELYDILLELNKRMAIMIVSHDIRAISGYVKSFICVNKTVHTHPTNELPSETQLYYCPAQFVRN